MKTLNILVCQKAGQSGSCLIRRIVKSSFSRDPIGEPGSSPWLEKEREAISYLAQVEASLNSLGQSLVDFKVKVDLEHNLQLSLNTPSELLSGANLYGFVGNSPVNLIDSLGLASEGQPCSCKVNGTPHFSADISSQITGNLITFSANNIQNDGGGLIDNIQPFWTTCFQNRQSNLAPGGNVNWSSGSSLTGTFYPRHTYSNAIVAGFKVDYLLCDQTTKKWVKKSQHVGSDSCTWTPYFWAFPSLGGSWSCSQ